ncbi:MAG: D-alanyl-D-alanine carboxypeptidase [Acidimicrobiales bacterium]|jgi:D-alanyl-D-alanine carboxypeptidase (penicillin-binding protein 5/6)
MRRVYMRRRLGAVVSLGVIVAGIIWLASGPSSVKPVRSGDPGSVESGPAELPSLHSLVPSLTRFPGTVPALPFPATGESAVFVGGVGLLAASAQQTPVPIASLTKIMTAVIVLRDHPLDGRSGPTFTMTEADHEAYIQAATSDESNLEVVPGERLSERRLLEALMIPSADNIADLLADWDAGSIPAFVRKMNATASALGLTGTHYADASGVNPASRSTAIDQAVLAAYAMSIPGMVSVEDHPTMPFPLEGAVMNYNPDLGQDGIIGLKSGFTSAAGGCLVTAAWRTVGGRRVLVVSSTLGQTLGLYEAGNVDLQLLDAASSDLEARTLVAKYGPVAVLSSGWSRRDVDVLALSPVTAVGWAGLAVATEVKAAIPVGPARRRGWRSGGTVATVEVSTSVGVESEAPAVLSRFFPAAPVGWMPKDRPAADSGSGS